MKMLMIDVENRKVEMVEANTLTDYYKLIGCRTIDIISRSIGDVRVEIVIDDEGTLVENPKPSGISVDGTPMLFGNLLIASGRVTEDGDLTELNQDEIEAIKTWCISSITTSVYKEPYPALVGVYY